MNPRIEKTKFGSITIAGTTYEHDVIIHMNGQVEKRKKKLSKEVFGTSHILSQAEAEYVFEEGAQRLIIGAGQQGMLKLSAEAIEYFKQKVCRVELWPTPEAILVWNNAEDATIGLFHITC